MRTFLNAATVLGLFVVAYYAARVLIEVFGTPPRPHVHNPETCDSCLPDYDHTPTEEEWIEFQRMLDDESQDGDDYR